MTEVLELPDRREQHAGSPVLRLEVVDGVADRPAEEVVGEHHDDAVARREVPRQAERLGDAARLLLNREVELVAEVAAEVVDVVGTGHEQQIAHARVVEEVDRPLDHGPVPDREQVLVRDPGERIQPRSGPARQDNPFHLCDAIGRQMNEEPRAWKTMRLAWILIDRARHLGSCSLRSAG